MQAAKPLTGKQKRILDFINSFVMERGYSPSLREIAGHIGKKLSTAQYFVNELEGKGYLVKSANKARGISPVPSQHNIPLLGYIAAGEPIEPIEDSEPVEVPINIKLSKNQSYYALRVKGDSMIDMGILDGDIVLIKHQLMANNGDVVVAITEKGATLKIFKKEGGKIILEPRNKDYPKIIPEQIEVRGKFVGLIRNN